MKPKRPRDAIQRAKAIGDIDKRWSLDDLVALIEANEPAPKKRGPYKKRATA